MNVDNRRHSRARVRWPVVIQTSSGLVNGKTENLSLGGAFIRLSNQLNTDNNLPLVLELKSSGRRSVIFQTIQDAWE